MSELRDDLRSYYEEEARLGLRKPLRGRRLDLRLDFLALLDQEGRTSVLDLGAGPGRDGTAFLAAGLRFVGIDLAHGNGVLAAEDGVTVTQGSIAAPPFRPRSFDAGWSMSTLQHVPEAEVAATVAAMVMPLRAGAPLVVGLWGGDGRDMIDESGIDGKRRLFSLRTQARNRELLGAGGFLEQESVWDVAENGWEYHVFQLRVSD